MLHAALALIEHQQSSIIVTEDRLLIYNVDYSFNFNSISSAFIIILFNFLMHLMIIRFHVFVFSRF